MLKENISAMYTYNIRAEHKKHDLITDLEVVDQPYIAQKQGN
jgi:hypothetical protein